MLLPNFDVKFARFSARITFAFAFVTLSELLSASSKISISDTVHNFWSEIKCL